MAQATYFNTAKRRNSTLVPSSGTAATLHLKEATSLLNPTFLLTAETVPAISEILFMGRYYFVDNIRSVRNGVWEIDCSVDVLATYKSQILAQSAYVLYSSSVNNPLITDPRVQRSATNVLSYGGGDLIPWYDADDIYILQVIGASGSSAGGFATTYVLSAENLDKLIELIFTDTDLQTELKEYFANYFDCFISCARTNYLPTSLVSDTVKLGTYDTGISCRRLTNATSTTEMSIEIPWNVSDYRRCDCEIKVYLPCIGCIELSASDFFNTDTFNVILKADWNTGNFLYEISNPVSNYNHTLATYSGKVYANIPIAAYGVEGGAAITSVGGGLLGGAYMAFDRVLRKIGIYEESGLDRFMYDFMHTISRSTASMIGGFANTNVGSASAIRCSVLRQERVIAPDNANANALWGRPYYNVLSNLSNLTGYLQCGDYNFSGNCTDAEKGMINGYMIGGIYIE